MIKIKDVLRTGHVTRWQIVRTARHQTLAEHMYIVAMLAQHIYKCVCPRKGLLESDELLVLRWALRHDLPEVMTGDIATPLKRRLRKLAAEDPIATIEEDVDPMYGALYQQVKNSPIYAIVKIADMMEGICFVNTEGMTSHSKKVEEKLTARLHQYISQCSVAFPDYSWNICRTIFNEILNGDDGMMDMEDE